MEKKILGFIRQHDMLQERDHILVGVSGGADSVCLLFVLFALQEVIKAKLFVLHINHQLRGMEADEDEEFVKRLCEKKEIPFFARHIDCQAVARQEKISLEEAGRKIRYESFFQYSDELGCNKIAVAHHLNDSAETILMNLFRGSGLKGLSGIEPFMGKIVRPLLCVSRLEIEQYLMEKGIVYRTDSTNALENHTRNKVRNKVLPYIIEEINTQSVAHIAQAGKYIREANTYFEKVSEKLFHKYVKKEEKMVILNVECVKQEESIVVHYLLRKCCGITLKDISNIHIDNMHKLCLSDTGKKIRLPNGIIVEKRYHTLIFRREEDSELNRQGSFFCRDISIPCIQEIEEKGITITFTIKECEKNEIIPQKRYTKWFDYDKIKIALQLRNRKSGDFIVVNAIGGRKKLKDYFIDEKIPREKRADVLLLADGSEIIWVIGYRMNEAYKVTKDTKAMLEVTVNGG